MFCVTILGSENRVFLYKIQKFVREFWIKNDERQVLIML